MTATAAARHTFEFFTARIPNPHTRDAYARAVWRFGTWCDQHEVALEAITPPIVAAYLQQLLEVVSVPSAKVHLSALRHWLDWLTERGVLPFNPALSVRAPRYAQREGKTPVLERDEARRLLDSLAGGDLLSLRDKAIISIMLFGAVRALQGSPQRSATTASGQPALQPQGSQDRARRGRARSALTPTDTIHHDGACEDIICKNKCLHFASIHIIMHACQT